MSSRFPKVFFIIPTTRFPPDGRIRLGQVLKHYRKPDESLLPSAEVECPPEIETTGTTQFVARIAANDDISIGTLATLYSKVTASITANYSANEEIALEAARLETQFAHIDDEKKFGDEIVKKDNVQKWLKKTWPFQKTAYVIVGLMIARNPSSFTCNVARRAEFETQLRAAFDPQGTAGLAAETANTHAADHHLEGTPENDYVFAYALRKIRMNWLTVKPHIGPLLGGGSLHNASEAGPDLYLDSSDDEGEGPDASEASVTEVLMAGEEFGEQLGEYEMAAKDVDNDNGDTYRLLQNKQRHL